MNKLKKTTLITGWSYGRIVGSNGKDTKIKDIPVKQTSGELHIP